MRVLIASDHYPPGTGGAERQTRLLGQVFHARGDTVAIAVPWFPGANRVDDDEGVAVHRVRQLRSAAEAGSGDAKKIHQHAPPFADPITTRELRALIQQIEPDLVHSHGWITYSVVAALKGTDIPLLATARDYGYFCATRTLLRDGTPCSGPSLGKCIACSGRYYGAPKGWVAAVGVRANLPRLRRRLSGLHSISTYVADSMREHLEPRDGTAQFVVPSFLDESRDRDESPDATREVVDALPSEPFILYVGQFRRAKGLDILLEAYAQLLDPPPLVLIGAYNWDGPSDFPPNVMAVTSVPHAAVMAAWERSLFGVAPSLWPEPFGAVVHEGMSRGRPVIGTRPGGHADMIVDGETGFLVPSGDVHALRQRMEQLVADPALRERLGDAARARAARFGAARVVPQFYEAFDAVARNGTGGK